MASRNSVGTVLSSHRCMCDWNEKKEFGLAARSILIAPLALELSFAEPIPSKRGRRVPCTIDLLFFAY